jgi:hypothetical protein
MMIMMAVLMMMMMMMISFMGIIKEKVGESL